VNLGVGWVLIFPSTDWVFRNAATGNAGAFAMLCGISDRPFGGAFSIRSSIVRFPGEFYANLGWLEVIVVRGVREYFERRGLTEKAQIAKQGLRSEICTPFAAGLLPRSMHKFQFCADIYCTDAHEQRSSCNN
jgi:hypothetical protein